MRRFRDRRYAIGRRWARTISVFLYALSLLSINQVAVAQNAQIAPVVNGGPSRFQAAPISTSNVILNLHPGENWFVLTRAISPQNAVSTLTLTESIPADVSLNVWIGPEPSRFVRTNYVSTPLQLKRTIPLTFVGTSNSLVVLEFIKTADDETVPAQVGNVPSNVPAPVLTHDSNYDNQTHFRREEPFNSYYLQHGQIDTFGDVTSRPFTLLGCLVQAYQRAILQSCGGGSVQLMNVLDFDFLYTPLISSIDGSPLPESDPSLVALTPPVSDANYSTLINGFVTTTVADVGPNGEPVKFSNYFLTHGGLDTLGAPTSGQVVMPGVIYQRFQRTILQYHLSPVSGNAVTEPMLLADYIKSIIIYTRDPSLTPPPLVIEVSGTPPNHSKYFAQYCPAPGVAGWLCHPQDLSPQGTDLTNAFEIG